MKITSKITGEAKNVTMRRFFLIAILVLITGLTNAQSYNESILAHREKYKNDFLEYERSPLKSADLQYLRFFEPDENFRVTADFIKTNDAIPFDLPTMNGKTKKYIEYGKINFELKERKFALTLYQGIALLEDPELRDYLFLPFTDSTNGEESYINGRYLEFRIGDIKHDKLDLDFNKAYNPYCAFSDGYSCPKPPEENALAIAVRAGEMSFGKERH